MPWKLEAVGVVWLEVCGRQQRQGYLVLVPAVEVVEEGEVGAGVVEEQVSFLVSGVSVDRAYHTALCIP